MCPTDHSVLPLSPSFMMRDPLTGRHSPGMQSNWTYSLDILSYCTCRNIFIHSIYAGTIVSTHADDVIVFNPGKKKKKKIEYDIFKEIREILRDALLKVLSFL